MEGEEGDTEGEETGKLPLQFLPQRVYCKQVENQPRGRSGSLSPEIREPTPCDARQPHITQACDEGQAHAPLR